MGAVDGRLVGLQDVMPTLLELAGVAIPGTVEGVSMLSARRDLQFRTRGVQIMLLCALVLRPLPPIVIERIQDYATVVGVEDGMVDVARRFADGALGLAAFDFERNGYSATWHDDDVDSLHTSVALSSHYGVVALVAIACSAPVIAVTAALAGSPMP